MKVDLLVNQSSHFSKDYLEKLYKEIKKITKGKRIRFKLRDQMPLGDNLINTDILLVHSNAEKDLPYYRGKYRVIRLKARTSTFCLAPDHYILRKSSIEELRNL